MRLRPAQAIKIDLQTQRIAELETQASRIAVLERVVFDMGKMLDQLRRTDNLTASLPSR